MLKPSNQARMEEERIEKWVIRYIRENGEERINRNLILKFLIY